MKNGGGTATATKSSRQAQPAVAAPSAKPRVQGVQPIPFQSSAGNLAMQAALGRSGAGSTSLSRPDDPDERDAERKAELFATRHPDGPLERSAYESFFGADLSAVRIHTGEQAQSSARALNARAYAHGTDVYFGAGEYAPGTREGRRLLAHELAHVAQDRSPGRVRRQIFEEGLTDAQIDERLARFLELQPRLNFLDYAVRFGGLAGWRTRLPRSYAAARPRWVALYSEPAVVSIETHDAEILPLVRTSEAVQDALDESRTYWGQLEHREETEAGQAVVDFYGGWNERGLYQVSYSYFAQQYADDIHFDLRLHQQLLSRGAADLVQDVAGEAFVAVTDARAAREQREAWAEAAQALVGEQVAKREGIFLDDDLELEALLDPPYGSEDYDEILAIARIAGRMSAVVRIDRRYYGYALSEDYDREDIVLTSEIDRRTEIVEAGSGTARAMTIVTSDGFVARLDSESGRYLGAYARDPLRDLEADTRLLESGEADRLGLAPTAIFLSMVRNLALANLREAEQRMNGIVSQMAPAYFVDPTRGAALQRDTARLRDLTIEANALANEIGDNEPSEEQGDQRDTLLDEMGELVMENPAAAFFVQRQPHWLWQVNDAQAALAGPGGLIGAAVGGYALSQAGVPQETIEDRLQGLMAGDAAQAAIDEARTRLENIGKVRRALFDDPDVALGFEPLHGPVFEHFSEGDRLRIRMSLAWRDFKDTAATIGLAALDLGLLIGGFFTGGATWLGLGLEAAGTGLGLYQMQAQIEQARMLTAESQLDVPGGFQMATEEEAASARRWAVIGAALTFLGMCGLARSASRLIREAESEAVLVGRIARRAGISSETAALALRRTWRGIPNPDPDALRELLLAGLPRQLRERYARLPIEVLDEEAWAARFGANSTEHAATSFATRANGEVYPTSVAFRGRGNIFALQEEAAHIAQTADPEMVARMRTLADVSVSSWAQMSSVQRLGTMRTVLEVELDSQQRLLARAQEAGDLEAMDDIWSEIENLHTRIDDVERAIADPAAGNPSWFDPSRAPTHLFNAPRLPRSRGTWSSGTPGNGVWMSTQPQVRALAPQGVRFRNHYPDFRPWAVAEVRIGQTGLATDFADADLRFAERVIRGDPNLPPNLNPSNFMHNGEAIAAGTERYRRAAGLTWHHHQGGNVMLLVPTRLHANVPHTGGASAARAAGP